MFPSQLTRPLYSTWLFFLLAALLGASMRFAFVVDMPDWYHYRNMQHAHSHVALMGWLGASLFLVIVHQFGLITRFALRIFWFLQFCVLLMLASFPIQGYGAVSILFSTLYLVASFVFGFYILRSRNEKRDAVRSWAGRFLHTAIIFMMVSGLGLFALGPIMQSSLRGGPWYYGVIQFFLHFQFNGWFVFALLAIIFRILEQNKIYPPTKLIRPFYHLLVLSCILTFALAVTWSTPNVLLFITNSLGVLLQGCALFLLYRILIKIRVSSKQILNSMTLRLWTFALICLGVKMFIQTLVAIPDIAIVSYTIRNFVIGFIHLLMLGTLSTFMFGYYFQYGLRLHKFGIGLFLVALVGSELLLFGQGLLLWMKEGFIPHYYLLLAIMSAMIPIGILIAVIRSMHDKKNSTPQTSNLSQDH